MAPGIPHHVTQRGNRRRETFLCDEDYETYPALMAEWCGERTGRPLSAAGFVDRGDKVLARVLAPRRPGRKPKAKRPASSRAKANQR